MTGRPLMGFLKDYVVEVLFRGESTPIISFDEYDIASHAETILSQH
jgi:hypothetical protein